MQSQNLVPLTNEGCKLTTTSSFRKPVDSSLIHKILIKPHFTEGIAPISKFKFDIKPGTKYNTHYGMFPNTLLSNSLFKEKKVLKRMSSHQTNTWPVESGLLLPIR